MEEGCRRVVWPWSIDKDSGDDVTRIVGRHKRAGVVSMHGVLRCLGTR